MNAFRNGISCKYFTIYNCYKKYVQSFKQFETQKKLNEDSYYEIVSTHFLRI